jgi:hypothetical protein
MAEIRTQDLVQSVTAMPTRRMAVPTEFSRYHDSPFRVPLFERGERFKATNGDGDKKLSTKYT